MCFFPIWIGTGSVQTFLTRRNGANTQRTQTLKHNNSGENDTTMDDGPTRVTHRPQGPCNGDGVPLPDPP